MFLFEIHYALLNNHTTIQFPRHKHLNNQVIQLESKTNPDTSTIKSTFFFLKKECNIDPPEPDILKKYFQQYIREIFIPLVRENTHTDICKDCLYIHIRGGDIFSNNPHKAYVPPPLSYYTDIIETYDAVKLVCEDHLNPCVDELLKIHKVKEVSKSFIDDVSILSNASNIVIGFGTFGFLIYLMNIKLKRLYIPDYAMVAFPKRSWGDNLEVIVVKLPEYIKVSEWYNTVEQRKKMIQYKI